MAVKRELQQAPYPVLGLSKLKNGVVGSVVDAFHTANGKGIWHGLHILNRVRPPPGGNVSGQTRPLRRWVTRGGPALERQPLRRDSPRYKKEGFASWYGPRFHGASTASLEPYDQELMTAAHRTLPFGTVLKVTNRGASHITVSSGLPKDAAVISPLLFGVLEHAPEGHRPAADNGRSCVVRVNDRGPYPGVAGPDHYHDDNRVIDLSKAAARTLDMLGCGVAPILIQELPHSGVEGTHRIDSTARREAEKYEFGQVGAGTGHMGMMLAMISPIFGRRGGRK